VRQPTAFPNKKKGTRQCKKKCGLKAGHYSTTCPLNQDVTARGRSGHRGRQGTIGTKRGRPPINRQLEFEFMEGASEEDTDEEIYEIENKETLKMLVTLSLVCKYF
jgi:hypothetical protein